MCNIYLVNITVIVVLNNYSLSFLFVIINFVYFFGCILLFQIYS